MKLKVLLPVICCLFYFSQSFAQYQNTHFFKNSGREVKVRDSADYVMVISDPDSGSVLFNVAEYYINHKPKLVGKTSKSGSMLLEGECTRYFLSGIKQQLANYNQGSLVGDVFDYYPNGKLYTYKQYISKETNPNLDFFNNFLIKICNDSTGKVLVADGNGYYIGYENDYKNIYNENDFKSIFEEGDVKLGLKDGKWKGGSGDKKNKITFNEEYDNGKMVSGQSFDKDGQVYNYAKREIPPEFKGGSERFYKYISNHIKYPARAKKNNIQGRVFISFVIDKDGTLTDIKAVRSPDPELSAEAMRVLQESPKWSAGLQYGRPVRVSYTVPINFGLGTQ